MWWSLAASLRKRGVWLGTSSQLYDIMINEKIVKTHVVLTIEVSISCSWRIPETPKARVAEGNCKTSVLLVYFPFGESQLKNGYISLPTVSKLCVLNVVKLNAKD